MSTDAPLNASEPLVRVHGLNFHFGEGDTCKQVLCDNQLQVHPGELVIMTGPSGSGKTTLLTIIGALRTATEGSVRVLGRELVGADRATQLELRRQIGFIFQLHNLFESLTALDNVSLAMELHATSRNEILDRSRAMLARLGLDQRLHYKPKALSGGQRQRVAIARALVAAPRLVLADEPTAALDRESSGLVVDLLRELARESGCAILMVTHDNRILDLADRVVTMVDGRVASDIHVERTLRICDKMRESSVFEGMPPQELIEIASCFVAEDVTVGQAIIRQGEIGDSCLFIEAGEFDVFVDDKDGRRKTGTVQLGECCGFMSLLTGKPRHHSVIARTPAKVLILSATDFHAAMDRSESFREQLLRSVARR